jgi:hypothetical protein
MVNSVILLKVSAFSGLAGAILSQTLTGMFAYTATSAKQKQSQELLSGINGQRLPKNTIM